MKANRGFHYSLGFALSMSLLAALSVGSAVAAPAKDAQWIWSPAQSKEEVPQTDCYFRKTFDSGVPEGAQIEITADDAYELYVNGRLVGQGKNWKRLDRYSISQYLLIGGNTIAVKVSNTEGGSAALVARVLVKEQGGTEVSYSTDTTWKTSLRSTAQWNKRSLDDTQWVAAQSFGTLGETLPWGNETQLASDSQRFDVMPEFEVEWVIAPSNAGSLIAMTFNEFGQIIASRENGPLILVTDRDHDTIHESVSIYCDQIKNCQGLLALNGKVLAVGEGPEGSALYQLEDKDRNNKIDKITALVRFDGKLGEHGPHAVTLGPDGYIYLMAGNHTKFKRAAAAESPYRDFYEGDLNLPRYEDPGGHALGVKVPGGRVLRIDAAGQTLETFAGGLRNAYDLAFNRQGDLFTYDSDMESNLGLPWYRPTRLNHVVPGGEYGWRSGWAKWPGYFVDGLPATLEMGPGSPTGMVVYNHIEYPVRLHDALFVCDWAQGRINVVRMELDGGSYRARTDVFVQGRPLNVTDIDVGPDGAIYFCTGGRGTEGGIYSVSWNGEVPDSARNLGLGVQRAIRQPQLHSAWARQEVAKLRQNMGSQWGPQLIRFATSARQRPIDRVRAIDLMQLFGPFPTSELLLDLSSDAEPKVRRKAAYLMGIHTDDATNERLVALLEDRDPHVRRQACDSLVRARHSPPIAKLLNLLADRDRTVAFAARRALEREPLHRWKIYALEDKRSRVFLHASTALLTVSPKQDSAVAILDRCLRMIRGDVHDADYPPGFISDHDFTELLRVIQLALLRAKIPAEQVGELAKELANEYPSRDPIINRELVRLLVYLNEPSVTARIVEQLKSQIPDEEKLHVAAHAAFLKDGWTTQQKLELLRFYERARTMEGGNAFARYIENVARNFFANLDYDERQLVLDGGLQWPGSALAALAGLPAQLDDRTIAQLITLDEQLQNEKGEAFDRLRLGIVAVLARNGDPQGMGHLRTVYEHDPDRRMMVAMGLAQQPDGENWPLLVRALPILEGAAAREVLNRLATVDRRSERPQDVRQLILCGLRLKDEANTTPLVLALLRHWEPDGPQEVGDDPIAALAAWQTWFAAAYPNQPRADLPAVSQESKWTYAELVSFLESPSGQNGSVVAGADVYEKAQCAKCHRFGNRGDGIGPDLTTISRRFHNKEILQSILFPSHVISDQYATKIVTTVNGRSFSGLVASAGGNDIVVLQSTGEKVTIAKADIEQVAPSKKSSMPEGLLERLTLDEVADLFAYLRESPRANVTSRRIEAPR